MWPFRKTTRPRRAERLAARAAGASAWRRFRQSGGLALALTGLLLYAPAVLMDAWPLDPFPYRLRQYLPADVHARVRFRALSEKLLEEARRRARNSTPAVLRPDEAAVREIMGALRDLPRRLAPASQPADVEAGLRERLGLKDAAPLAAWKVWADPNAAADYKALMDKLEAALATTPVVRLEDARREPLWHTPERAMMLTTVPAEGWPSPDAPVEKQLPAGTLRRDAGELIDVADKEALERAAARLAEPFPLAIRKGLESHLAGALREDPVYRYDKKATQMLMEEAAAAVDAHPPQEVYVPYEPGELIARRSRQVAPGGKEKVEGLSGETLQVLLAEHKAFRIQQQSHPVRYWGRIVGRAGLLALLLSLLGLYGFHYQRRFITNQLRAFTLLLLLVSMLGLAKVLMGVLGLNPHAAILPVMMTAVILAIGWDGRFALAVGAALGLVVVLQLRGGIGLFLVLLTTAASATFQLGEIRSRGKLTVVAAVSAAIAAGMVWTHSLTGSVPWNFALLDTLWAGGSAMMVGFIIQGVLPMIERIFRVATSMTLLEWCDASRPLLKRLAMEAPGTYNHSLQLGAMCEAAADAIGARGLLARVGAYYHDAGKINKPEYFVENQTDAISRHARLAPTMSLLIIIGHVKDGLELAREYGLPKVLHEFIATHHGTTLVQYFYQAAAEQRRGESDRPPDESEFRYPGPKPTSKEPAILMLADAAESSIRAMSEPTPGRIENQVHAIVNRRLMDGQLDECELTLKEVHQIETSLVKSLCSMYHARPSYPTPAGQRPSAAELHPRQPAEGANGQPQEPNGQPARAAADGNNRRPNGR